jgi:parallel beta-helix repeat protein
MNGVQLVGAKNVRVTNNRIQPSTLETQGPCSLFSGITAAGGTTGHIGQNTIRDFREHGIEARGAGTSVEIEANTIRFIHVDWNPSAGSGVRVHTAAQAWVDHNSISVAQGRTIDSGVELYNPAFVAVRNNTIDRAPRGIQVRANGSDILSNAITRGQVGIELGVAHNVTVQSNKASLASVHGIWVSELASSNDILDNDFRGNTGIDCVDQGGTPLDNDWSGNDGDESSPAEICEDVPA